MTNSKINPPAPSSQTAPAELTKLLPRNFAVLLDTFDEDDYEQAYAAISDLFSHQQREIEEARQEMLDLWNVREREVIAIRDENERLKDEELTAEEARVFLERAEADLADREPAAFAWAFQPAFESAVLKLRRRLHPEEQK